MIQGQLTCPQRRNACVVECRTALCQRGGEIGGGLKKLRRTWEVTARVGCACGDELDQG
jgi:hypothetical protein